MGKGREGRWEEIRGRRKEEQKMVERESSGKKGMRLERMRIRKEYLEGKERGRGILEERDGKCYV